MARSIELPETPVVPDERVVSIVAGLHGDLYALTSSGQLFMRVRDQDQPHFMARMKWVKIEGPVV